jgi:CBS domain containing-hemolysin-like protein
VTTTPASTTPAPLPITEPQAVPRPFAWLDAILPDWHWLPSASDTGWILVALVGLFGAAFFAGSEIGLYSVNRVRLRIRAARTTPVDRLARTLAGDVQRADRTLPALLIGFNVFSAIASLGLTAFLTGRGYSETQQIIINILLITPLLFVFTDTLPKEVFRADPDGFAYAAAPAVRLWRLATTITGVLPLVRAIAGLMARVVTRGAMDDPVHARQHIQTLLKEGAGHGVISQSQLTLLDQAFALRFSRVRDEMIPWSKAQLIDVSWPAQRILEHLAQHRASRFPLVDQRGLVIGLVSHVDLCTALAPGPLSQGGASPEPPPETPALLRSLATPALVLSPDTPVREALAQLTRRGTKLAVVVSGSRPIGLVTVKDLIEPLTGELQAL